MSEITIDVPPELLTDAPITAPPVGRKRVSNPGRQALASVADLFSDIPGAFGLAGSAIEATFNNLTTPNTTFFKEFDKAQEEGVDKTLSDLGTAGINATNSVLGIENPTSTEDLLARNIGLFLPIPGPGKIAAGKKILKGAGALFNTLLPTVKRGPLPNMLARGGVQGSIGTGFSEGVKALVDNPTMPLLLSDTALSGGLTPEEVKQIQQNQANKHLLNNEITIDVPDTIAVGTDSDITIDLSDPITIDVPDPITIDVPELSVQQAEADALEMDRKMQDAETFSDVRAYAIILGSLIAGTYAAHRALIRNPPKKLSSPPTPENARYLQEQFLDKGTVPEHVFEEMGLSKSAHEAVDDSVHMDIAGTAKEAVDTGRLGQRFDNVKFPSFGQVELDADFSALKQSKMADGRTKAQLFNDARKAQSELSFTKNGRAASLWRSGISDAKLSKDVEAAYADDAIRALMIKHAKNARADLEFKVHRKLYTEEYAARLIREHGDIYAVGGRGTYMRFIGKSPMDYLNAIIRKTTGWNNRAGDEVNAIAAHHKRDGGLSENIMDADQAWKTSRYYDNMLANDQFFKFTILSKAAGIAAKASNPSGFLRTGIDATGNIIPATKAMAKAQTGRGTKLLGTSDVDLDDYVNAIINPASDDIRVTQKAMSVNDLEAKIGANKLEVVLHRGRLYAFEVPDSGLKASVNLSPQLSKILEFNNFWRGLMTQFATGKYSVFFPISHAFAAQTVSKTTAAYEGVAQGIKSVGRSAKGSINVFVEDASNILADYLVRSIATQTGFGQGSQLLAARLRARYANSMLHAVRLESGKLETGINAAQKTIQQIEDEFGKDFSNFFGVREMGAVKRLWLAINTAANEGPAFGVIAREVGKQVDAGKTPNVEQIRSAVEKGKLYAGDAGRVGASPVALAVNKSIPFAAPTFQAWSAVGSAIKHNPKKFLMGMMALVGAPTISEYGYNMALSKAFEEKGITFKDAKGKEWSYRDYLFNGFTTEQRVSNYIIMVPGRHPKDAILWPISAEFGLFRAIVIESLDAIFNMSDVGDLAVANQGRGRIGRDHLIAATTRFGHAPFPPLLAGTLSLMGLDVRSGFQTVSGSPDQPGDSISPIAVLPIGKGERVTSEMGASRDVNGTIDKNIAAMLRNILATGGAAYVSLHNNIAAGITNEGGSIGKGLSQGLDSLLDSIGSAAKIGNPIWGNSFKQTNVNEISKELFTKRNSLKSLINDAKILSNKQSTVFIDGVEQPIDTVIKTTDPLRIELAKQAEIADSNISMLDESIARLKSDNTKLALSSKFNSNRERQEEINSNISQINRWMAQQVAVLLTFEDKWSEDLSKRFKRTIKVDLSGGVGTTTAARPNLNSASPTPPTPPQTSQ